MACQGEVTDRELSHDSLFMCSDPRLKEINPISSSVVFFMNSSVWFLAQWDRPFVWKLLWIQSHKSLLSMFIFIDKILSYSLNPTSCEAKTVAQWCYFFCFCVKGCSCAWSQTWIQLNAGPHRGVYCRWGRRDDRSIKRTSGVAYGERNLITWSRRENRSLLPFCAHLHVGNTTSLPPP